MVVNITEGGGSTWPAKGWPSCPHTALPSFWILYTTAPNWSRLCSHFFPVGRLPSRRRLTGFSLHILQIGQGPTLHLRPWSLFSPRYWKKILYFQESDVIFCAATWKLTLPQHICLPPYGLTTQIAPPLVGILSAVILTHSNRGGKGTHTLTT